MREEERLNESELEAEAALSGLKPARPATTVQQVVMEAARRRAVHQIWLWRGIAASLGLGLVLAVFLRPAPRTVEKLVYITPPQPAPRQLAQGPSPQVPQAAFFDLPTRAGNDYLSVRDHVLVLGVQGLPRLRPEDGAFPGTDRVQEPRLRDTNPDASGVFKFLNWM